MNHCKEEHKRRAIDGDRDLLEFLQSGVVLLEGITFMSVSASVMSFSKLS